MSLSTRLSVFFLGTLAVILVGFSATLYGLAHTYLNRQVDDRLEAALNVMSVTAEIKPNGVDWENRDHPVSLPTPPGEAAIVWMVNDDRGRAIDGSRDRGDAPFPADGPSWRVRTRRLPDEIARPPESEATRRFEDQRDNTYRYLVLSVGLPLGAVAATLRNLLLLLVGLSVALWLAAALVGGWLCRRALSPVLSMAEAASSMNAADLGKRLPRVTTGDELEKLNRAFNELLSRLQESFERQARFTGKASHQLRTPLTSMLGHIEIALRRPRDAEEYQRVLTVLRDQTEQMRQVVEMLLFLARADAEAKAPQLERLNLRTWLAEHLEAWSGHLRAADLRLNIGGNELLWVRAQGPLLGQLLDNLLDNAFKYTATGMPITLSLAAEDGQAKLTVEDAGHGIAPEDLPHVFEPFFRSAQARGLGVPGIGLGLAVAQRIAQALGGALRVESEPGHGSRFILQLPTAPQDDPAKP
jgi:heavy metal sensor kinase